MNDGHASAETVPLRITIVGADRTAKMSVFSVVSGTSQNDTFNNIGNGVTIFGAAAKDTFVFKAGFTSATIADFDVNKDTIDIDHTLFANLAAILVRAGDPNIAAMAASGRMHRARGLGAIRDLTFLASL